MAEDGDIKIYVGRRENENDEFETLSDNIKRNAQNGNSEKAKKLGELMAQVKPTEELTESSGLDLTASVLYQTRVLLTFVAEYVVQKNIGDKFLSDAVSSAMYDYLKANERGYYDNISDGSAFTFYLLALNKDGNLSDNVGKEFAMRCSIKSAEIESFGSKVFEYGIAKFTKLIEQAQFSK